MGKYVVTAYKEDKSIAACVEIEANTAKVAATYTMKGCLNGTNLTYYSLAVCKNAARCKSWLLRITDLSTGNTYLISARVKEKMRKPEKTYVTDTLYGMSSAQKAQFYSKNN